MSICVFVYPSHHIFIPLILGIINLSESAFSCLANRSLRIMVHPICLINLHYARRLLAHIYRNNYFPKSISRKVNVESNATDRFKRFFFPLVCAEQIKSTREYLSSFPLIFEGENLENRASRCFRVTLPIYELISGVDEHCSSSLIT